jgi:hypothetical protein
MALAMAALVSIPAHAASIYSSNLSTATPGAGQLGFNTTIAGITTPAAPGSYNFVFSGPTTAATGEYGAISMDAATTADAGDTQDHGYFLALDGVFQVAAVDVAVTTIAGDVYTVTFDWAADQQSGYSGTSTDFLTVALGGDAGQNTGTLSISSQGFSGWKTVTDTFTASTTGTEQLSFLDTGTPTGGNQEPAFALVDNINVSTPTTSTIPEPNSLMLLSTGLLGLGGFVRSRLKKSAAANL